jgi:tetratricopeptide (TPR) repeat protein
MKVLHTHAALLLKHLLKLEKCGGYEEAFEHLEDIWEDTSIFPNVEEFEPRAAAEIIMRCGNLIGLDGHKKQIPNSQERSKNLLTEAYNRFLDINDVEKITECETYLALVYWRTGELVEAEVWIDEALSHDLPDSNGIRLFSYIIESKIDLANKKYEKICNNSKKLETAFLKYADDFNRGNLYNNWGLALKNLGNTSDALIKLEIGKDFYFKAENKIHYAVAQNNLAQLYKSEGKFPKAFDAIDNATKTFKQIKDKTRQGFSLDTKAQIYFSEGKYPDALKTIEKAIDILKKSENQSYLVETYLTKVKILIYLNDFSAATLCLCEAVQVAKTNISEEKAEKLVKEFEAVIQEKNSAVIKEIFSEKEVSSEDLELILPPSISHYDKLQGVWIKSNLLEHTGLVKDSLAVVVNEKVKRGDLVALAELSDDSVSCGFYDVDFGIVCLEGGNSELQLFDEKDVRIIGKIIGVCRKGKNSEGKMIVEPIDI